MKWGPIVSIGAWPSPPGPDCTAAVCCAVHPNIIENIICYKTKYKILTYIWCIETLSKNEENF